MNNLVTAQKSWGETMPTWVRELARACDETSQSRSAREIGYAVAVVNQVLLNKYKGSLSRVEAQVKAVFMGEMVDCHALGEIPALACEAWRKKPFASTNPVRVRMWVACRECGKGGAK
ncbi:MAG: hypothetical protein HQL86_02060 [Magnetococcales bacterium]|nr:hypothetical protein [Magnetococcales bacterium]